MARRTMHRSSLTASILLVTGLLPAQHRIALTEGWTIAPETSAGQRPTNDWRPAAVGRAFEHDLGITFDGTAWYRIDVEQEIGPGQRARLLFHGVATAATVFADGAQVGGHLGAWTPFHVDVTDALADGRVEIAVRVDERVGHNTQGFLPIIQPHFGGIWRSVHLCIDDGPVLDRERIATFGDATEHGPEFAFTAPVLGATQDLALRVTLSHGSRIAAQGTFRFQDGSDQAEGVLRPPHAALWSPSDPTLHDVRLDLLRVAGDREQLVDSVTRRVGFRRLGADGTQILWNGERLQLRGMLHWGYSPPHLAPPEDPAFWRTQLEGIKQLGCNMLKACLWMPPPVVYDLADELGLIVWQEYPTWHPTLTAEHLDDLKREYAEFHVQDRSHPSVAFRSLTCETGHSAELDVLDALYRQCKEMVPQTLVVDDSAWIEWHRIHDFYDDHPYGNNSWWPGKIRSMRAHIDARAAKPLLLGECIAADTWLDMRALEASGLAEDAWWATWGIDAQRAFAARLERLHGPSTAAALVPDSLAYALRNRKYQIERLRMSFPEAGYTLSVARDFTKARMGFFDDFGRLKWDEEAFSFHGDTMLGLDVADDRRSFLPGPTELPIRVAHHGHLDLEGVVTVRIPELGFEARMDVTVPQGTVSPPLGFTVDLPPVAQPRRLRLEVALDGSHETRNAWDLWVQPPPHGVLPRDVLVVDRLDRATWESLQTGARVLLRAGNRKGSLKTSGLWFLRGAPIAPPHPILRTLPREFLMELQSFDLETGEVLFGEHLFDHVDPILAFWDTHDIREVRPWILASTTRVGRGRLGLTTLADDSAAGRLVLEALAETLSSGPDPRRALPDALVESLGAALDAEAVPIDRFEIALDPEDVGREAQWADGGEHAGAAWRAIRPARHWEAEGIPGYDGVAWFRTQIEVPTSWRDRPITAVFEGVDDSYRLYLDGREIARHGDPETGETVWLIRTTADLTPHVVPGKTHSLVLRVVDHNGAGGLHRPVWMTNGPVDARGDLIH
jgi:hypothetical protein